MFVNKFRPSGIEVPACDRCNHGSANADQLAAFFCFSQAISLLQGKENEAEFLSFKKVLNGVANNNQHTQKFFADAGIIWTKLNGVHRPMHRVEINKTAVGDELNPWAVKQVLALWYDQTGEIVPEDAVVFVQWISLIERKANPKIERLLRTLPNKKTLRQGKKSVADQFQTNFKIEPELGIGQFQFSYHRGASFFALMFHSAKAAAQVKPDLLEANFRAYSTSLENGIFEI